MKGRILVIPTIWYGRALYPPQKFQTTHPKYLDDPAFGTPDFDAEQGRTWYLRCLAQAGYGWWYGNAGAGLGWMLRSAARPLSDFPIER